MINGNINFRYLDAVQLIKHYFGLAHEYADSGLGLEIGYVFWEPGGDEDVPDPVIKLYADHRDECERFTDLVSGDKIRFSFYSYCELIEYWRGSGMSDELLDHFEQFHGKYKI